MHLFSRAFILVVLVLVPGAFLNAQNTGYLPSPSTFPLFRPSTDLGEGYYSNLPLRLSVFTAVGYDDNVFAQHSNQRGSGFTELSLIVGSHIGNERTRLDAELATGLDFYWDRPGRSIDPNISLTLSLSHQLSPRAYLTFNDYFSYAAEPNLQLGVGVTNRVSNYFYTANTLAFGYQWTPRFSTVTSYTANVLYYDNSSIGNSINRLENLIAQQFRFLVLPTVTAVAEYRFGYIDYFSNSGLNSYSNYALGGADLTLSSRLALSFRAGAEFIHYERQQPGQQQDLVDPFVESTLTYQYQPGSDLEWYNRYGVEQSDLGQGYRRTYRTGLKISHRAGERLRLVGAIYYSYNEYVNPSFTENVLDLNLGVTYQINRAFALTAGYTFERDFSDVITRDYYRDRVYLGAIVAF
jgi:Putative beta-barrel porin 2